MSGKRAPYFGTLSKGPNERNREDTEQYNIVTNVNLGKLLPQNGKLISLLIMLLVRKLLAAIL
jgi:cell surface protein SprA